MDSREPPPPQPQPQPPSMMVGPASSYPSVMAPATARFPFNSNPPPDPFNDATTANNNNTATCEATLKPCGLPSDSAKKKRGRPRKYSPDGNIALGLGPGPGPGPTHASSSSAEPPAKKHRGRPPGSGKKQMDALGIGGTGFTPHVILAEAGEDIAAKLMAFCHQGLRTVCILSATGAICNVTLRQSETSGGGVSYEVLLDILKITVVITEIIVGSFVADGKKSSSSNPKSGPAVTPSSQMVTFGGPVTPTTPTSQGNSTESSDDNENGHFSKGSGDPGLYNNNASQSVHNIPMYHHQLWAGQTQQ
uniref:AT-hook motif nuclear-localized protein n=1 Tax=Cajanus cajan TaxID=3821 RepID=A0A151TJ51_CAJCA|nr:hypothetical protein KK1_013382 [Cajanus cajan]